MARESARRRLVQRAPRAAFDGAIVSLDVTIGEAVVPGETLLTLADLTTLEVETTDPGVVALAGIVFGMGARG
ncbi:MAG: hypothetical protein PVG25_06050 [Anaerolineae bacterium]